MITKKTKKQLANLRCNYSPCAYQKLTGDRHFEYVSFRLDELWRDPNKLSLATIDKRQIKSIKDVDAYKEDLDLLARQLYDAFDNNLIYLMDDLDKITENMHLINPTEGVYVITPEACENIIASQPTKQKKDEE